MTPEALRGVLDQAIDQKSLVTLYASAGGKLSLTGGYDNDECSLTYARVRADDLIEAGYAYEHFLIDPAAIHSAALISRDHPAFSKEFPAGGYS